VFQVRIQCAVGTLVPASPNHLHAYENDDVAAREPNNLFETLQEPVANTWVSGAKGL
jgi:hypothetical protein